MSFTDKLDILMEQHNLNKNQLAKESGIPYTTIDGFYKKGSDNVKLSTLRKLATYFGCSLDYLADDEIAVDYYIDENKKNEHYQGYYLDEEVAQKAQEIYEDRDTRILLDAKRDLKKEDLDYIVGLVKRLKGDE